MKGKTVLVRCSTQSPPMNNSGIKSKHYGVVKWTECPNYTQMWILFHMWGFGKGRLGQNSLQRPPPFFNYLQSGERMFGLDRGGDCVLME